MSASIDPIAWNYLVLCVSAFAAGAINAVAGGGTLLTFPALTGLVPANIANGTSTIALLPGSLASAWGYRKEFAAVRPIAMQLMVPSFFGGLLGAILLAAFPAAFRDLVPWLILVAAILFLLQPFISKALKPKTLAGEVPTAPRRGVTIGVMIFQFGVATYGGYFGAGIGILMLAALGLMNIGDIHRMNAVKTFLASIINLVSIVVFIAADLIRWDYAAAMAASATLGGYGGARIARRIPARFVRLTVIVIAFGLALYYFTKPSIEPALNP